MLKCKAKQLLATIIVFTMILGMVPLQVFATEDTKTEDISKIEEYLNQVKPFHKEQSVTFNSNVIDQESLDVMDEGGPIDIENFGFYCNDGDHMIFDIKEKTINSGKIKDTAPQTINATVEDKEEYYKHTYVAAYVYKTPITHVGKLIVEGVEYIFYVTDGDTENSVVYSVLKPNEKINLEYSHEESLAISYQFKTDGAITELGPAGVSIDEVFGEERSRFLPVDSALAIDVEIPRGYTANIIAVSNGIELHRANNIGDMPTYRLDGDNSFRRWEY